VVVMIREPISIVASAYEYHARNMEAHWTGVELPPRVPTPIIRKKGGGLIVMNESFLGCAPNRTHLFFKEYTSNALQAMRRAAGSTDAWRGGAAVKLGAENGSFSAFLQLAPADVGLLAQLWQSRSEVCEVAIAHARTSRSGGLVVRLETLDGTASSVKSWAAIEQRLVDGTGCRIRSPPTVVRARLRALLAPSKRSSHASQAAAGVIERNRRRARQLDREHLAGWYSRMGVLLGYPERANVVVHGSGSPGKLAVEQVRTLCTGLHADAKMPDLSSRR